VPFLSQVLPLAIALTAAQPAPPAPPAAGPEPPAVVVRLERRGEWFRFHVDNPSNFESGPLVPHFFEQRYDADNTWVLVKAQYRLAGSAAATEVGFAPAITTAASDIDTFFQPSGDVITSGTRGAVRLQRLSIQQWFEMAAWRAWRLGISAAYRRSEMDFLPSDRIVTRSRPPSETREPVGGDETTWSHVVASGVTASAPLTLAPGWRLLVDLEAMPLTRARLTISLPLKYPGEIIRQDTFSFGARGRAAVERRAGRFGVGAAVTIGGAWGYRASANYRERLLGGEVFMRVAR
jgi:hypothetical protein